MSLTWVLEKMARDVGLLRDQAANDQQMGGAAGGPPLAPLPNGSAQKKPRHTLALPVLMEEEDSDDEDDSDGDLGSPCPLPKHGEPAKQPASTQQDSGRQYA